MQPSYTYTVTYKNLPCWHPVRQMHRNPSFDRENDWLFDLFSRRRPLSLWQRLKAFVVRELAPVADHLRRTVDK